MYTTIDLCAGIGGIRKGFELTGEFVNVLSAEIDDYACRTYEHLFGENPKNDVTSEAFKIKVEQTEYDVLLAGFPCQTFSRAGKQLGFRDSTKGTIFFDIADIISRTNPKAIFLENVENLYSHEKGATLKTIIETLESELDYRLIGVTLDEDGFFQYSSKSFIRNSRYFGLPQNRQRVYIMGFSKKLFGDAVRVLNDALPVKGEKTIANSLIDILETNVDDEYYMAEGYLETLKRHKARQTEKGNGFGYVVVNRPGVAHPIANTILATGGSGRERNLIFQPKEGVAGKQLPTKKTALNHEGIRIMTPTEWGRLQGFIGYAFIERGVDRFSFPKGISREQQYKQFGNSVTIPVIESMAGYMLECFEKMTKAQMRLIVKLASQREYINKRDIIESLRISVNRANYLLRKLVDDGDILIVHRGRHAKYSIKYEKQ